jgi:organic radical activating enzyme
MKKPIEIKNNDYEDFLSIDFYLTNVCNYSCHYCHPGLNEGDKRFFQDYKLFIKNVDHLLTVYKKNFNKKRIKIELSGGEPSLWPKVGEFAKHLKETHPEIICISITTNASRTMRWWEENAQYFDEVHISLHAEGDPYHIIKVADYVFNKTENHVAVNVMLDPTNWDQSVNYLNTVVNHPVPWLVKSWLLVKGATVREDYTKEQLEEFQDRVKKVPPQEYITRMEERGAISKPSLAKMLFDDGSIESFTKLALKRMPGDNNYYGWLCNVGVDRFSIMFGNFVASCGANYLFNLDTPLSLYDNDFVSKFVPEIVKPTICREIVCGGCTKDLRIPKKKIQTENKVFLILNEK